MRVVHLNNEKTWRGGERQTFLLAEALAQHGVESVIACRPGGLLWQHASQHGVPVLPFAANSLVAGLQLARFGRRFDLVHCHTARAHSIAATVAGLVGRPLIATRRVDFEPPHTWFNHYKYRRADRVVGVCEFITNQLAAWGVAGEKLSTISSTIPAPRDDGPGRDDLRRQLDLPLDRPIIGNIAALVGHKDQATLLRAARAVADRRADVLFVVIGEGDLRAALLRQQKELGLDATVRFLGFVPEAQRFMRAFDVFVMSSCMEGRGGIVLDAFATRVPVASTAGGGLPELVRDGETGLLVPVGDDAALANAIVRLLDDRDLTGRVTATARAWLEREFTVERMAERYLALYRELLGQ
jgi:glycosyltransferase involved in cell wall biosynthesis